MYWGSVCRMYKSHEKIKSLISCPELVLSYNCLLLLMLLLMTMTMMMMMIICHQKWRHYTCIQISGYNNRYIIKVRHNRCNFLAQNVNTIVIPRVNGRYFRCNIRKYETNVWTKTTYLLYLHKVTRYHSINRIYDVPFFVQQIRFFTNTVTPPAPRRPQFVVFGQTKFV